VRSFSRIGRLLVPGVLLLGLWLVSPVKANEGSKDQGPTSVKADGDQSSDSEQYVAAGKKDGKKKAAKGKGKKKGGPKKACKGKKGKGKKGTGKGKKRAF